ncbi:protein PHOTOPERIOD-INDEPENDENT EARLY FLOWERING 1 isoform X1 [Typha latifolia]|uniref:protein PHOTOPERIOD-INDEPENDENT EARLY FLOWERING 1 isoform X1 n=2 Tax=Typha latifolia TaxID=4733 RepID=UPI003C30AB41
MASKGPRSKLDHETRARRQKALEAPREPPRPKTHWDHVLEEMIWLSKDFESERKWKLAQAKKVALRASKNVLDQATRGEKKLKEEEQRLKKVALNISKDVKKFWMKIEKLVLYKYQLELEERKKKALDKQLDFLLGQTERYSTMLAENLVDVPYSSNPPVSPALDQSCDLNKEVNRSCLTRSDGNLANQLDDLETDDDYKKESEDDLEDDEHTIEQDEAQITDAERREELSALQAEAELPIEELLKCYTNSNDSREGSPVSGEDLAKPTAKKHQIKDSWNQVNGSKKATASPPKNVHLPAGSSTDKEIENSNLRNLSTQPHDGASNGNSCLGEQLPVKKSEWELPLNFLDRSDMEMSLLNSVDEQDDKEYDDGDEEAKDDETTLSEEEEMEKREKRDPLDEIKLLQKESEIPIEELLAIYRKDGCADGGPGESECASSSSDDQIDFKTHQDVQHGSVNFTEEDGSVEQHKPTRSSEQESGIKDKEVNHDKMTDGRESEDIIADAAAAARSAQPTGNTFSTTKVRTKFPFLLKHPLREYQHIGLDWLVAMYERRLNGILADEMGLGKTIMTIALLAHLACEKGIWGPHLIVVPTSVMLNWETEFLKWCPAFRILTYFGNAKERKNKRQGWLKPNSFHVCITTYRLVIQDSKVFKRKKWKYLILDEAHLIKNWKSQRWQTLLNFNSKRRILLTGTPLQNDLMELWSLMHFLMPHIFQSHQEFKDWFSNPISGMVEGQEKVNKEVVDRLHNVLRPFILRRLKRDVEKQLPQKHEHVINCRLSRRQRNLYEDFIASSETQATLASSNFFGMISIIMQLRKVCNHPDLFEGRPIISSFDMTGVDMQLSSSVCTILSAGPFSEVDLRGMNFIFTQNDFDITSWEVDEIATIAASLNVTQDTYDGELSCFSKNDQKRRCHGTNIFEEIQMALWEERIKQSKERAASIAWWNTLKCRKKPVYGTNLRELVTIKHPVSHIHDQKNNPSCHMNYSSRLADIVLSPVERFQRMLDLVESFMFAIPASRAPPPVCWSSKVSCPVFLGPAYKETCMEVFSPLLSPIRTAIVRRQVYFPDRRLIQFDCGKLQELAVLLRRLKAQGHRALIFTQMTKMLDILEEFINLYGYTYMRLDGSTPPEERQTLMQRFNTNSKFFLFILSTRSGGVGINLVGADTVIFYDSDWNPAMDQQAQDRCHRIGQTREVHIYRLISESTIEENILKKANQKRALDDLVIQSGSYNTEFFKKLDPMELFSGHEALHVEHLNKENLVAAECSASGMELPLSNADVELAIKYAEDEADYMALKKVEQEDAVDNQEFTEEVIGRLDDDDVVNEDDVKPEEIVRREEKNTEEQSCMSFVVSRDEDLTLSRGNMNEKKALTLVGGDEEMDMLADVKQMAAAAAAAGQASSSFENQLRPIDRYAMRFLDLWYPVIDKSAMEYQVNVEEEEWELDRIEKFKEDLEAEIDEDQEPLLYERWDADFATTAYRQHVEALAQRQLMEELENEAQEANDLEEENHDDIWTTTPVEHKPKPKKKQKKTKFKSLKKGPLASELEVVHEEPTKDFMTVDDVSTESPTHSFPRKKRKKNMGASEEENSSAKSSKKLKKPSKGNSILHSGLSAKQLKETRELKTGDGASSLDFKPVNKDKMGGRISISYVPIKRVMVVKPEKLRKRGHAWPKDCTPDSWSLQEDATLCAVVHEYGTNWSLVSDALYFMSGGGIYRGRFRHPIHCCERFRELFFKYVLSSVDCSNSDKVSSSGSGKALLKVTEDQARLLLNVTSELPDNELLLQKHFVAILSSVWRAKCSFEHRQTMLCPQSDVHSFGLLSNSSGKKFSRLTKYMNLTNCRESSKLVMTALADAYREKQKESVFLPSQLESRTEVTEQVDVTVEFPEEQADYDNAFPSSISVSVHVMEALHLASEPVGQVLQAESSCRIAENRFRMASEACFEGDGSAWASSAFPTCDLTKYKSGSKSQSLGKHKPFSDTVKPPKSKVPRTAEPHEGLALFSKAFLQSPSRTPTGLTEYFNMPHTILDSISGHSQFPPMDLLPQESEGMELIPYEYDPSFLAGLEELDSLVDFADIG